MMFAAFGMYNWQEAKPSLLSFWEDLRSRVKLQGLQADEALEENRNYYDIWQDPNLLISQTCGYPYVMKLRGKARLVATPHYDVEGCEGATYRSVLVKRRTDPRQSIEDFEGASAAVNSLDSQSGYNALTGTLAREGLEGPFLGRLVMSGGHRESTRCVTSGQADLCAVDAVCWRMLQDFEPETANMLEPVIWSDAVPGLPYVTAVDATDETVGVLQNALSGMMQAGAYNVKGLYLNGISTLNDEDYNGVTGMADLARQAGFDKLKPLASQAAA